MSTNLVNIIFGMKVRQARTEAGLTLTEFAAQCDLSASYVTEIERGRKYPRVDKIMRMAEVLGKPYDELVSIRLSPSLRHLESALSSSLVRQFPFEEFGFESADLVHLLTREPEKVSALLHAILEIARRYDLQDEEFLRGALRSYQEIHENYFPEIEESVQAFTAELGPAFGFTAAAPPALETMQRILQERFAYMLDTETIAAQPLLQPYRAVLLPGERPSLLINSRLYPRQVKFILARELGFQYLQLQERSTTSAPEEVHSFKQLLNDFRASYFAGALLIPRGPILADLERFFRQERWQPQLLEGMLTTYDVTPEMLFYRFSELIPQHFGIKIHFLRFHQSNGDYKLVKHLNLNQLIVPSGIALQEHFCRRWLSVRLLREMKAAQQAGGERPFPPPGIHISEFHDSDEQFMAIGFARSLVLSPGVNSSVTFGFRITPALQRLVRFLNDPTIPRVVINETCERCPLTAAQCADRAAPPTVLAAQQQQQARKALLDSLPQPMISS